MKIYASEQSLKDKLSDNKISFASQLRRGEPDIDATAQIVKFATATNKDQPDLYYMDSILVSVGINKNDDYFDSEEVWVARKTPEDKQINYEHNEKDIIGHITSCYAVDEDLKRIPEDVPVDRLPKKYHIVTGGVLYKKWEDDDLRKRMGEILEEIEAGELYVSMECLFNDFDYILIEETGKASVIDRNSSTAYLTKYLRVYGGDGVYQNKRIGRVIRNITFSGKGIVRKPANPDSIIFSNTSPVLVKANENNGEELIMKVDQEITAKVEPSPEFEAVASELREVKQLLVEEKKSKAEVKAQAEKDAKAKAEKELSDLKDSLKSKDAEIESLKAKVAEGEKSVADAAKKIEDAEKASQAAQKELADIAAKAKVADRIAKLVKAGKSEKDATELEVKFAKVDDEAFAAIVENLTVVATETESDDDEDANEENANATVLENLEVTKTQKGAKASSKKTDLEEVFSGMTSAFAGYSKYGKSKSKKDE